MEIMSKLAKKYKVFGKKWFTIAGKVTKVKKLNFLIAGVSKRDGDK